MMLGCPMWVWITIGILLIFVLEIHSDECIKMAANVEGQYVFNCPMVKA
jgi:hypothetical protein